MGLVDYHIHTYLCGHAEGQPDDYIRQAIKENILDIGFADHAPLPSGLREGITMTPENTEVYIKTIEEIREIYKDKISIKIGFEVDYPLHDSFDKRYYNDLRLDFLIGSIHYIGDWAFDHPANIGEFDNRDINDVYDQYYKIIEEAAQYGYFDIIGHFDLVKKFGHRPKKDFTKRIETIAHILSKNNIAVEVNTAGMRKPAEEVYPSDDIIDIFYRMDVALTLGSDSHKPEEVGYGFHQAIENLKRAGYREISGFSKRRRYRIPI